MCEAHDQALPHLAEDECVLDTEEVRAICLTRPHADRGSVDAG